MVILKRKRADDHDDDPRPAKFRNMNGYEDRFRNMLINYEAKSHHGLAFRYLFPKANLQEAARDHAYTKLPFTEHWVEYEIQVSLIVYIAIYNNNLCTSIVYYYVYSNLND